MHVESFWHFRMHLLWDFGRCVCDGYYFGVNEYFLVRWEFVWGERCLNTYNLISSLKVNEIIPGKVWIVLRRVWETRLNAIFFEAFTLNPKHFIFPHSRFSWWPEHLADPSRSSSKSKSISNNQIKINCQRNCSKKKKRKTSVYVHQHAVAQAENQIYKRVRAVAFDQHRPARSLQLSNVQHRPNRHAPCHTVRLSLSLSLTRKHLFPLTVAQPKSQRTGVPATKHHCHRNRVSAQQHPIHFRSAKMFNRNSERETATLFERQRHRHCIVFKPNAMLFFCTTVNAVAVLCVLLLLVFIIIAAVVPSSHAWRATVGQTDKREQFVLPEIPEEERKTEMYWLTGLTGLTGWVRTWLHISVRLVVHPESLLYLRRTPDVSATANFDILLLVFYIKIETENWRRFHRL